jgi:hypothetical protein
VIEKVSPLILHHWVVVAIAEEEIQNDVQNAVAEAIVMNEKYDRVRLFNQAHLKKHCSRELNNISALERGHE